MDSLSPDRAPVDDAAERLRIVRDAQRALLQGVLTHGTATADDIRAVVPIPDRINPVCLRAAPRPLARLGIIRRNGYVETKRRCAHSRPLRVWEPVDRPAAVAWLAAHPPLVTTERE